MFTDPTTGELTNGVKRVRWNHDALIDQMIAEPQLTQNELAITFGRTPAWISTLINSDAFQARLEARRKEIIDPTLTAGVGERLRALADVSLQRLLDKVSTPVQTVSDDFLLQTTKVVVQALGYGARPTSGAANVNVGVVVQVPPKAATTQEWMASVEPRG